MNEASIDPRSPYAAIRKRIGNRMLLAGAVMAIAFFIVPILPVGQITVTVLVALFFLLSCCVALSAIPLYACPICRFPLSIGETLRGPGIAKVCQSCKTDLTKPLTASTA